MLIKASTLETFVGDSQFDHMEEFREHLNLWLVMLKSEFTKSELKGLQ